MVFDFTKIYPVKSPLCWWLLRPGLWTCIPEAWLWGHRFLEICLEKSENPRIFSKSSDKCYNHYNHSYILINDFCYQSNIFVIIIIARPSCYSAPQLQTAPVQVNNYAYLAPYQTSSYYASGKMVRCQPGATVATCDLIHREGTVTTNFCYSSYMDSKIKEIIYSMSIYIYV